MGLGPGGLLREGAGSKDRVRSHTASKPVQRVAITRSSKTPFGGHISLGGVRCSSECRGHRFSEGCRFMRMKHVSCE
jgi:hypothetical protein